MNKIKFLKVREGVKTPERGTKLSSGIDFFIPPICSIRDDIRFTPTKAVDQNRARGENLGKEFIAVPSGYGVMIPSGLKVRLPRAPSEYYTYEMSMHNKSGIAVKHGLVVGAQIVDNDYTGEFNLHLINTGPGIIVLEEGQKVVQGIVRTVELQEIGEISEEEFNKETTERGEGKMGSTGV